MHMERTLGRPDSYLSKSHSHCGRVHCMAPVPSQGRVQRSARVQKECVPQDSWGDAAGSRDYLALPTGLDYKSVCDFSQSDSWNL